MNADEYLGFVISHLPQTGETAEQILDQAAEHINQHGWCRGTVQDEKGRVCLEGAIRQGREGARLLDSSALLTAWRALTVSLNINPIAWNDMTCRDADDAIHALKRAKEFL